MVEVSHGCPPRRRTLDSPAGDRIGAGVDVNGDCVASPHAEQIPEQMSVEERRTARSQPVSTDIAAATADAPGGSSRADGLSLRQSIPRSQRSACVPQAQVE